MKSAAYAFLLGLAITLCGCGSSSNPSTASNPNGLSGLKNRAFVANSLHTITGAGGGIQIIDAQHDQLSNFFVQGLTGISPQNMLVIPGTVPCRNNTASTNKICGLGLTFSTNNNTLYVFDPTNESTLGSVALPGPIGNYVLSPDFRFVYAAVPQLGEVLTIDIEGFTLFPIVNVLGAHNVALSPDGSTLMITSDATDPSHKGGTVTVMNTASRTTSTIADPNSYVDHPVAAFFLDNNNAAVLSCGAECGGLQAGVASISLSAQQAINNTAIDGGTTGLLIDNQLFVAGNCVALPCASGQRGGELSFVALTPTGGSVGSVVHITGGYHQFITPVANDTELFIGSIGEPGPGQCANPGGATPGDPGGCLSIMNITSHHVSTDTPRGDASSAAQIPNRSVVYVTEGGDLLIYDSQTMALDANTQVIPVTGFLVAVQAAD